MIKNIVIFFNKTDTLTQAIEMRCLSKFTMCLTREYAFRVKEYDSSVLTEVEDEKVDVMELSDDSLVELTEEISKAPTSISLSEKPISFIQPIAPCTPSSSFIAPEPIPTTKPTQSSSKPTPSLPITPIKSTPNIIFIIVIVSTLVLIVLSGIGYYLYARKY